MSKVTDWIPCTTQPSRAGFYDLKRRTAHGEKLDVRRVKWSKKRREFTHKKGWPIPVIDTQDFWRGLKTAAIKGKR